MAQIRVFECTKVTKSFTARFACSARTYEYYLPVAALGIPTGRALDIGCAVGGTCFELARHCSAIDAVRLSRSCRVLHERVADPSTAAWCAESRRALLRRRRRAGDLPLDTQGTWTLERLHLCERPPRFPRVYFEFASEELTGEGKQRARRVARLLATHPKLRVRIHGFAQPDAPGPIGECLAQVSRKG